MLNTTRKIHIAKAITWRVFATLTTFFVGWAITGSASIGAAIGGVEAIIKIILYYVHERAWFGIERQVYAVEP